VSRNDSLFRTTWPVNRLSDPRTRQRIGVEAGVHHGGRSTPAASFAAVYFRPTWSRNDCRQQCCPNDVIYRPQRAAGLFALSLARARARARRRFRAYRATGDDKRLTGSPSNGKPSAAWAGTAQTTRKSRGLRVSGRVARDRRAHTRTDSATSGAEMGTLDTLLFRRIPAQIAQRADHAR